MEAARPVRRCGSGKQTNRKAGTAPRPDPYGGTTHFAVDREAVERAAVAVGGIDNVRADARANRAFLGRAVRYLAGEGGVRQFLDIGTGIPNDDNVHAIAQRTAPSCRIAYVDHDPIVLAHAHQLLHTTPHGATAYIDGDLRDSDAIVRAAANTLDLSQPVAILLAAVLHHVGDEDDPYGIVARLLDAVCPGSYLAASHPTPDFAPDAMAELADRLNATARETFVMRDHAGFRRFFDGVEIIEPGAVQVDQWRPDQPVPARRWVPSLYGAVGHKAERPARLKSRRSGRDDRVISGGYGASMWELPGRPRGQPRCW